uniref:RNA-binding protein 28 n=1 Tax=Ascaris suum TaxID=6253 RepID=F1KXM3_ASCSU
MSSRRRTQHRVDEDSDSEEENLELPIGSGKGTARGVEKIDGRKYFQDAKRKGWRLIMRNIAFNTKKEDLQVLCSKFGPFTEIVLPSCKDPRYPQSCAGFAFIQFRDRKDAKNAMQSLNMSEVNGRKVAVDWAIDKDTYESANFEERTVEKEKKEIKVKSPEAKVDVEKASGSRGNEEDENEESASEEPSEDEIERDKLESHEGFSNRKQSECESKPNEAIQQHRVVFVRNMTYETTDEMLKEALSKFGQIELAIICRYADSDHSKGSGFVYFESKSDADTCLDAITTDPGVTIDGRRIFGHRALPRNDAAAIEKENLKKRLKDKRNLHLLRVGIVRAGTAAAKGMSEMDAKKRAKLALAAKAKLRNLHMFVSPLRLVVHNLPTSLTDKALRSLCFLAAGNPDAKITECRIWRDKGRLDEKGTGKSRGFGFVAFSEHSDALAALRNLNNNPKTFTDQKRPIVEFSVENLSALRLRESRLTKSKEKLAKERGMSGRTLREVEETKREMASGGQKPLPSHTGPKIRHSRFTKEKSA